MSVLEDLVQASTVSPVAMREVFARYLADEIEVRHQPADPTDGVYPAKTLLEVLAQREELFTTLMPDYAETSRVSGDGDEITVELNLTGTLPDGTAIDVKGTDVVLVREGRIVRLTGSFDAEQMRPLVQALRG
ncbi:nuclear transport factor 2 family protein [Kineosporia sp. NBRC 101731]|uniref:nuclear transport factor 2 family protein n=1 Tax=Kineosporia sp. NBRC 101731 TaxID=3032199 RepID=UPI0024A4011C|nr:nuclear transport factor 2 family protein [Kineosporia sp. NBRC 101731]GLY33016.1 hypothetical protein Kisp02_63810 [Kineosporia sp. NBRC 101731]